MLYIVSDVNLITSDSKEKIILDDNEDLPTLIFSLQQNNCVTREKHEDLSAEAKRYLDDIASRSGSNPYFKNIMLHLFNTFSWHIYRGMDIYVICNNKYTVKSILLYEIIGFIVDRYNTNYTEINCMDDYNAVRELEIAAPYLEVLDKDVRGLMMSKF